MNCKSRTTLKTMESDMEDTAEETLQLRISSEKALKNLSMSFYHDDTIRKQKQIICDPYEFLFEERDPPKKKTNAKLVKSGKLILANKTAKKLLPKVQTLKSLLNKSQESIKIGSSPDPHKRIINIDHKKKFSVLKISVKNFKPLGTGKKAIAQKKKFEVI